MKGPRRQLWTRSGAKNWSKRDEKGMMVNYGVLFGCLWALLLKKPGVSKDEQLELEENKTA